jgi:hypothetical protein
MLLGLTASSLIAVFSNPYGGRVFIIAAIATFIIFLFIL